MNGPWNDSSLDPVNSFGSRLFIKSNGSRVFEIERLRETRNPVPFFTVEVVHQQAEISFRIQSGRFTATAEQQNIASLKYPRLFKRREQTVPRKIVRHLGASLRVLGILFSTRRGGGNFKVALRPLKIYPKAGGWR